MVTREYDEPRLTTFRFDADDELFELIELAAKRSNRTVSAEIIRRLRHSFVDNPYPVSPNK